MSIMLVVEMDTPCTSILLVVERDTPCTSILLAVERDTPCTVRPYCWRGRGYTLHIHSAGIVKGYTLHVHRRLLMVLFLLYDVETRM
jgi:hypothetical protein